METQNEIGTEVNLRLFRVADRFRSVEAHMATLLWNAQLPTEGKGLIELAKEAY